MLAKQLLSLPCRFVKTLIHIISKGSSSWISFSGSKDSHSSGFSWYVSIRYFICLFIFEFNEMHGCIIVLSESSFLTLGAHAQRGLQ